MRDRIAHRRDVSPLCSLGQLSFPLELAHWGKRGGIGGCGCVGCGGGCCGGVDHAQGRPSALQRAHDVDAAPARHAASPVPGDHLDPTDSLRELRRGLLELIPWHAVRLAHRLPIAPHLLGELAMEDGQGYDHIAALRAERFELVNRGRRQPAAHHAHGQFRTPAYREAHHHLRLLWLAIGLGLCEVGDDAAHLRICACECQSCCCLGQRRLECAIDHRHNARDLREKVGILCTPARGTARGRCHTLKPLWLQRDHLATDGHTIAAVRLY
mmetsp:Transcript_37877/g.122496  ORF Transcript_37877/g.122496 Transcript_37877/m.122496 type:complete len:270 (-) Transcript_37877:224-1033(-)